MKKTPSTPECEEVLEELRKKYYNPREGSSKQYEYNNLSIQNVSIFVVNEKKNFFVTFQKSSLHESCIMAQIFFLLRPFSVCMSSSLRYRTYFCKSMMIVTSVSRIICSDLRFIAF